MGMFRLSILLPLLALSWVTPLQATAKGHPAGYIQYVNKLHGMIEVNYPKELKVEKLSALKNIISGLRKSKATQGKNELNMILASMECTLMLEVIDASSGRKKIETKLEYWVSPCDFNAPRYTFDSPKENISITQLLLPL